jgi:hypothetical protein
MEKYFKKMRVDTSMSFEDNLLSEYASYFEKSLIWTKVGQSYLEGKDDYTDTTVFKSMHELIKQITTFV